MIIITCGSVVEGGRGSRLRVETVSLEPDEPASSPSGLLFAGPP